MDAYLGVPCCTGLSSSLRHPGEDKGLARCGSTVPLRLLGWCRGQWGNAWVVNAYLTGSPRRESGEGILGR
jgi:hypothetical protein